jgi:hypothetical protein
MPTLAQKPSISPSTVKRPMKLIDPSTGLMECAECGPTHWASINPQSGEVLSRRLAMLIGSLSDKATLSKRSKQRRETASRRYEE